MGLHLSIRYRRQFTLSDEALSQRDPKSLEPPIDEDQIMYEAVGKHDLKGRVYSFGSQASISYYGSSSADSSRPPSYRVEDVELLWEEYEECKVRCRKSRSVSKKRCRI